MPHQNSTDTSSQLLVPIGSHVTCPLLKSIMEFFGIPAELGSDGNRLKEVDTAQWISFKRVVLGRIAV